MRDFDLALRLSAACLALPRATFHARLHVRRSCYASFSVSRALDLPPLVRATPAAVSLPCLSAFSFTISFITNAPLPHARPSYPMHTPRPTRSRVTRAPAPRVQTRW